MVKPYCSNFRVLTTDVSISMVSMIPTHINHDACFVLLI